MATCVRPGPMPPKPRKRTKKGRFMRRMSPKRQEQELLYRDLKFVYMSEHRVCEVPGCMRYSQHLHHVKGRYKYLCDVTTFKAVCFKCHHWLHFEEPKKARELGLLV